MIPDRSLKLVKQFETLSKPLGQNVLRILEESCKPSDKRRCAGHDVTEERLKDLLKYIEQATSSFNSIHFLRFVETGFDLLKDKIEWARVEKELYEVEAVQVYTRRKGSILASLIHLAKTYFDDPSLSSPSRVRSSTSDLSIDISKLYIYSAETVVDCSDLFLNVLKKPNGYNKYKSGVHWISQALVNAKGDEALKRAFEKKKTVVDIIDDDTTFEMLKSKIPSDNHSRIIKFRSAHNPQLHGLESKSAKKSSHVLKAGNIKRGAVWIYELSPVWFIQCQEYVNEVHKTRGKTAALSAITRLTKLGSAIYDHKNKLPDLKDFKSEGVLAFYKNGHSLAKSVYQIKEKRVADTLGELIAVHNYVYGSDWKITSLLNLVVKFDNESSDDSDNHIVLDPLLDEFPHLAQSIFDFAQYELNRIDGDKNSRNTVFSQVSILKNIFKNHLGTLRKAEVKPLQEHGVEGLAMNDCRLIKKIRFIIRDKYQTGEFTLQTARFSQSVLSLFCSHFNLPKVKSYSISKTKRKANEDKNRASDYYSLRDVASLAYSIEVGLLDNSLSSKDELFLRLGRVLLKTGWNLDPVLMLEIDDLLKLDAPIVGKTTNFVRLFKKRAGYKTQFYEFNIDEKGIEKEGLVFGKEVTNALSDLEYIRDKISARIRPSLQENSKLKYRLSLYRASNGRIYSPSFNNFNSQINQILRKYECSISFNVQRIRKGGLNYVYKSYAKKFKKYYEAGQHSLSVFLDVYLRDDGLESEETISSATSIMADYFTGRPLAEDIIIVTDIPPESKQTPSGLCVSAGNDEEAEAFVKLRRRLNRESGSDNSQCGDFNACLFCRHYRLVADAEHVWRLLSYQSYVVGEMERGISDYESSTDQSEYINLLNKRVEKILADVEEINSAAVRDGEYEFKTKGCHKDWAFFANFGSES
jgi:hypothetical protein|tara:strand:- start:3195 stop:5960 length:2766 start_codon:yes stop_codon:yes gene_type:complete